MHVISKDPFGKLLAISQMMQMQLLVDDIPTGVAALRVLMDQYRLSYSDLKEEIGSKSLVSQILSGKRSLTIAHIKALSKRFNVRPDIFL
ncbi:transcriptional regulator [Photorhabdus luminescens]|nr:transcriptional regulator [Photorhabdus luminescens]PQQ29088.1 transcriptional regulator [Photorhabdus luminescens]